jgi:hypothetical protein
MNSLLRFNREERPEATMGSGGYYARFSQGEPAPTNIPNNVTTWLFEAFDAVWFDEAPAPETPEGLANAFGR